MAKALVKEEKAARDKKGGPPPPKSGKGTWAPAEAAAAARGYAAMVKSQSASYTVRYPGGGEAGAVRTASGRCSPPRGARRRRLGGTRAARGERRRGAAEPRTFARRGFAVPARRMRRRRRRTASGCGAVGSTAARRFASGPAADGPGPVGSSLDGPGSSLDPLGSSLDASGSFDMGASRDDAYAAYMSDDVEDSFEDDSYDEQVAKSMLRGYAD